jgi:hypothetical protein
MRSVIHQLFLLLKAFSNVMVWCYVVILIEFCLAPLFACRGMILIIGRIRKKLLIHLIASLPSFQSNVC